MADLTDVSATLVQLIAATLYPNGTSAPSISGGNVRVFPGWPLPAQLQAELAGNISSVSIYPRPEERNTTRYMNRWQSLNANAKLIQLSVSGQTVTVFGQIPPASNPHHVMLMVNRHPYPYLVQTTDTLASIATALVQLVNGDHPGLISSSGAVITLDRSLRLDAARVGISQTAMNEVGRQERVFQISVWANSPGMRTAIAKPVDLALRKTLRFALPDGSWARLIYKNSIETDDLSKVQIYRRDLFYTVEFATFDSETEYEITQVAVNVTAEVGAGENADAPQIAPTVYS